MSSLQRNVSSEQLLAEHTPALRNFFGARCRDADLTAEMLQEVAARLVTAMPRLSLNGNARRSPWRTPRPATRSSRRQRDSSGEPRWRALPMSRTSERLGGWSVESHRSVAARCGLNLALIRPEV